MNRIIISVLCLALLGCTKDFPGINTNPNAPVSVQPSLLLRQVIYDYGEAMSYEGFVAGNLLGQYFTAIDFNLFDRHSLSEPQVGGNPWPVLYANLRDNELLLKQALSQPAFAVYEGPALILKAYLTAALTDIYGDVPYQEALRGTEGIVAPAFDHQSDIYLGPDGILDNLEKGRAALNAYLGSLPLQGDILFGGDLEAWAAFAQSLRIKSLMRISGRTDVSAALQAIYEEGGYMQVNEQNAVFSFTNEQPNNFRMARLRAGDFNLFILSETMEAALKEVDDPRMAIWFRPAASEPGAYLGLRNGPDASQTSISVADFSLAGTIFREETGRLNANFITAWETSLWLAEAAERGYINADAKALYDQGVQLAFEYWQVPMPDGYLSTGPAAYGLDGSDKIAQIIRQKWLANIINGYEGWIEWRRTGWPELLPVSASLNNGLIPVRMPYPSSEAALNPVGFESAAAATQGNSVNAPVWWDVD